MIELVIKGGIVLTVGSFGTLEADVGIEGGRIVAIAPQLGRGEEEIDAQGMFVIPGLVQAHVHLCQTLFRNLADDLDVVDWLRHWIWPLESAHDAASMRASCRLGIAELLLGGTTSVLTMETIAHTDEAFQAADDLGIRAVIGKALMDRREPGTEMTGESTDDAYRDLVEIFEHWHGAADQRLGVAVSPRSPRNATPDLWAESVKLAEAADLRIHTHVNENKDQAARLARTAGGRDVYALEAWGALGPRLVMAHCVWLDDGERALIRQRKPHICHCPSANLKLASGIAPIPEYLGDGLNVALGADGAACNNRLDPFEEMRLAALIHKPRCGAMAMSATTVLEMATIRGARALGLDQLVGSIEVGKIADLVLIRREQPHATPWARSSPVVQLVYAHRASDVDTVLVAGHPVVRGAELMTADVETIMVEAETARRELLSRCPAVDTSSLGL